MTNMTDKKSNFWLSTFSNKDERNFEQQMNGQ